ncbi:hypothetical protein LEP1GSC132_4056 [Leptospira kirschneri str. 200803703]|uniref:Uncharacterized protein n=1 Tax=Leptospira kirschneri str. 200802841 TaxID=1193047 RepID=A0A828Y7Q2_9LEPT|nr:hypothetical protein LEP1GSC044_3009 [Leptospira kirschneri serovar Grippotyphosa str. RM52]EKO51451.1 hypothetical protein LEP1GSC131_1934 [Leptospira kirschneri str. 200802841]EKQ82563.1 hypothetical protein LEP1GSC064_1857 [Leptospira kirschneri serovar Grippotyphosa str. Moskva]EKR07423.1 hypothetical protein LEP1GSC122_2494 [Leptospira kirschneri serovar Valbuzzi str. 200702274]EMJ93811.1 hypothetical protein LEP1GSC198_2450 [Leptospira kirschneri str. JB]EMK06507.1 hypothetical protei
MMTVKQWFCAKIDWTMVLFVLPSSSHNFQSLTVNPRFVRVPTSIFFTKKLT